MKINPIVSLAMAAAMLSALAATPIWAQDFPKSGKFTYTFAYQGSANVLSIEGVTYGHSALTGPNWVSDGTGFYERTIADCMTAFVNYDFSGYCTFTMEDGDKIMITYKSKFTNPKHHGTIVGGTGKYEGITGKYSWTSVGQFPPPTGPGSVATAGYTEMEYEIK